MNTQLSGSAEGQPNPIKAAEVFIRGFCILPESAYLPLALWAVASHIPDAFGAFPYVALLSPAKGCGKTRVLEILELLCANPQRITSASPASIFRMMKDSPTLLLDEVEALRNSKPSESAQAILSILNAGHRKGATVTRCVPPDWHVEHFPVYGPKAFAAIGRLPDTLTDRCICIPMQRKTASQHVERFLFARAAADAKPVHDSIAAWAESSMDAVRQTYASMGDLGFLADREADLWMPVFAVCAVALPERIEELRKRALALCGAKAADDLDDSLALTLLADVRSVWTAGSTHMTTASLIEALESRSDNPWAEPEHKLTPRKLAGMLRPFGIEPRQVRIGSLSSKGYQRTDFEPAFSRYLPSKCIEKETSETTRINTGENARFPSETLPTCFGSENTLKPA
jgi:hypothetical protein